jgi:hypothetical protein
VSKNENTANEGSRKVVVAGGLLLLFILAAGMLVNMSRPMSNKGSALTACTQNLKNIGTALELYSTENREMYPDHIGRIVPAFMKEIPTCPASVKFNGLKIPLPFLGRECCFGRETPGVDTYSSGYSVSRKRDCFTVMCQGTCHLPEVPADYPRFDSVTGLIER